MQNSFLHPALHILHNSITPVLGLGYKLEIEIYNVNSKI